MNQTLTPLQNLGNKIVTSKKLWPHCGEAPWCRTMQKPSSLWISWWLSPQNCPFAMKQTTQNWGANNLVIIFSWIQMLVCKSKIWYKLTKNRQKKRQSYQKVFKLQPNYIGKKSWRHGTRIMLSTALPKWHCLFIT